MARDDLPSFEYFRKIALSTLFEKLGEAKTQEPLNNNKDHLRKRGAPPFFHSDTNLVLNHVLVHSVDKTHVLVVTVVLIWLLFLNILSFNFFPTSSRSLKFRRFRTSYVNCHVVVPTNHYQSCPALLFLLDVRCSKKPRSFFCNCLSPITVHLLNLFLLSATCLNVINSKVGKQTERYEIGKHFISRKTTFSPNSDIAEEATCFPFFTP